MRKIIILYLFAVVSATSTFALTVPIKHIVFPVYFRPSVGLLKPKVTSRVTLVQDSSITFDVSKKEYVFGHIYNFAWNGNGQTLDSFELIVGADSTDVGWNDSTPMKMIFNLQNGTLSTIEKYWENGMWWNYVKSSWSYPTSSSLADYDNIANVCGLPISFNVGNVSDISVNDLVGGTTGYDMQDWDTTNKIWVNDEKDTSFTLNDSMKVVACDSWQNNFWETALTDTFTITTLNGHINKLICVGSTGKNIDLYDSHGNDTMAITQSLINSTKTKFIQTYDTFGYLIESVLQDSLNGSWRSLDSCSKYIYSYDRDSTGRILSRKDSIYFMGSFTTMIHYFKYQLFSSVILPGNSNPLQPLCSNFPNPFKLKTFISYNVLENTAVSLRIYSLDGHLVQTLVNAKQAPGHYTISWDGMTDKGKMMARGVYLYQLITNGGIISKKMNFIQ